MRVATGTAPAQLARWSPEQLREAHLGSLNENEPVDDEMKSWDGVMGRDCASSLNYRWADSD